MQEKVHRRFNKGFLFIRGFSLINGSQGNSKGFSLVELIVAIATLGVLVMLGTPRFMGYVEKAELARIQHDVKIMEDKMAEKMVSGNEEYLSWDNNTKELGKLAMADMLFETKGLARGIVKPKTKRHGDMVSDVMLLGEEEIEHKDYKIVPNAVIKEIKSRLPGTFYSNIDGKVYYEHGKPLIGAKEDIVLGCESPEPLDYDFDETTGTIVKYNGNLQHMVIPSSFKVGELCYPVRIIGKGAFMRGNYGGVEQRPIKTIMIPPSVEIIEEDAFRDNNIENVTIPLSVTKIESNAFNGNDFVNPGSNGDLGGGNSGGAGVGSNNSGVVIQSAGGGGAEGTGGLSIDISSSAFSNNGPLGSSSITPQYKPITNKDIKTRIKVTKNKDGKKIGIITDYNGTDTSIVIPEVIVVDGEEVIVEEVDKGAYQGKGLISVNFPDGLKRIEDYAFAGNQIIGAFVPESVIHVGNYAFAFNEVTDRGNITHTINNIQIQNDEYIDKLDIEGNITKGGHKLTVVKEKTKLLEHIFATSKSPVIIDTNNDVKIESIYIRIDELRNLINNQNSSSTLEDFERVAIIISNIESSINLISDNKKRQQLQKELDAVTNNRYIPIATISDLDSIRNNPNGKYLQINDLDLSSISNFEPISRFTGVFDGNNFKIINLKINKPKDNSWIGFFKLISGATIKNMNLINVNIVGGNNTGSLCGRSGNSTVENVYSSGRVSGDKLVGGLIGFDYGSTIQNSNSSVSLKGNHDVGGLVGQTNLCTIRSSYFNGSVTSTQSGGGIVGYMHGNSKIENSYSIGRISGTGSFQGGLVGGNDGGSVINSYSIGRVTGSSHIGGLIGHSWNGKVTNSYYNRNTSGQNNSSGGTALTTTQMTQQSNYRGWRFVDVWKITSNQYPTLQWQN